MMRSIHFISKGIPGCGPPDSSCLPCSGVSGRAVAISPNSFHGDYKLISDVNFLSLKCASRYTSSICHASSSNYKRNPDFSRQNRNGFYRNRNRHSEERDGYEDHEESETLLSRNGPFLSVSGNQKFHATASPGPKEKEIVELFRKVQVQLRERAAMKEERKFEDSQGKTKESETVDSLLKLLRKHSVQQGKRNPSNSDSIDKDFVLGQPKQVNPVAEEDVSDLSETDNRSSKEMQESPATQFSRPKSNFQRRSPVPPVKFQPVYSEDSDASVLPDNLEGGRERIVAEPVPNGVNKAKSDFEAHVDPLFSGGNVFDDMSDDETSEIYGRVDVMEEQGPVETSNLSGMKLTELRALAKSRGLKGFSKLKKNELVELLSES